MHRFLVVLILTIFFTVSLHAQNESKNLTQSPKADPFMISKGKSFSASRSVIRNGDKREKRVSKKRIASDLKEAINLINNNHASESKFDYNELIKSSISAMLHELDPHSNYFDNTEFSELINEQNSEYFGIGATIANFETKGTFETFITSTYPDSPANRAGLRFGDRIIEVNGENVSSKSSLYVRNRVRGAKGTTVRLKIERVSNTKPFYISLRRNRVPQPSIQDAYIINSGVGYIDLSSSFNYTTINELNLALGELKRQGMKSLILDLRDNPGGILEQAVRVAEKFLPRGKTIVSQKGRYVIDNRKWTSRNKAPLDIPLVILVNDESASASEIVAGALQDYDRALIVGEKTFGKGLVQSIISLPYGSGLTLTTAKYYTPIGRSIQRDYSNGNLYDYYQQKVSLKNKQNKSRTINGRAVYSGDGITPDEIVKSKKFTETQIELLDNIFLFSRELASGKIQGFESYRIITQKNFGYRIKNNDYPTNKKLLLKFKSFVKNNKSVSEKTIEDNADFILLRIRYNLISAAYGNVTAKQVLIANDSQVLKAIENLPKATQLAKLSQKAAK